MLPGRQSSRFGVQAQHQMRIRHKRQFCEVCRFFFSIAEYKLLQSGAFGSYKVKLIRFLILGLHIYMAGIGFQLFFICVFLYFAIHLRQKMIRNTRAGISNPLSLKQVVEGKGNQAFLLLYVMYIAVFLIGVSSHRYLLDHPARFETFRVLRSPRFLFAGTYRLPSRRVRRGSEQCYSSPRSLPILS